MTATSAGPTSASCTTRAVRPRRPGAARFKQLLAARRPDLAIRKNYPYLGKSDGFTTSLRKKWDATVYLGIELEVNQRWPLGDRGAWRGLEREVAESLLSSVTCFSASERKM